MQKGIQVVWALVCQVRLFSEDEADLRHISARALGRETVEFIDTTVSEWNSQAGAIQPSQMDKQDIVDLMYTVIRETLLYSPELKEQFVQKLVVLCRECKTFPKVLKHSGLCFEDIHQPFAWGGNADIYRATLYNKKVIVKVPNSRIVSKYNKEDDWTVCSFNIS